jgi:hypothetical protein
VVAKPTDPMPLELSQFGSLEEAISAAQPDKRYEDIAVKLMERTGGHLTALGFFFLSAVSRARGLHEGIAHELLKSNPHSTFPLIRQFAESVAVVCYVADHPDYVHALMDHPRNLPRQIKRKSIQALVNYMDIKHSKQLGLVYAELCEITHYGSLAMWTSFNADDELRQSPGFTWASGPVWRGERQGIIACAWTVEIGNAMADAIHNLGASCIRELRPPAS